MGVYSRIGRVINPSFVILAFVILAFVILAFVILAEDLLRQKGCFAWLPT